MSARPLPLPLPEGLVWRADRLADVRQPGRPTGFAALDAQLPGGGWPPDALVELLCAQPGIGELSLLLPLLRATPADCWNVWVAPPFVPYAPALQQTGVDLARLLLVSPASPGEALWAGRQALQSGACAQLLLWHERTDNAALRRLQLAAEEACTPVFLFRPPSAANQASPASLRLQLQAAPDGRLQVHLLKRRGPQAAAPLILETERLPVRPHSRPPAREPAHAVVRPAAAGTGTRPIHALAGS